MDISDGKVTYRHAYSNSNSCFFSDVQVLRKLLADRDRGSHHQDDAVHFFVNGLEVSVCACGVAYNKPARSGSLLTSLRFSVDGLSVVVMSL